MFLCAPDDEAVLANSKGRGQPLAFQQRLQAVAANGRQQQHRQPQQKRFFPILARGQVQPASREFIQTLGNREVQHDRQHIAEADGKIQKQL